MKHGPKSVSFAGLGYRLLIGTSRAIPEKIAPSVLKILSFLYWFFALKTRKTVEFQLELLGHPKQGSREVFFHFSCFLYEFFSLKKPIVSQESTLKEQMTERFGPAGTQGGLLLLPHTGNWELALRWLLSQGYPVSTIAMGHSSKEVDSIFQELRSHQNLEVYPLKSGARNCIKALKNKRIIALACERDYTKQGLRVHLDRFSTNFPIGPAWLIRSGAWETALVDCKRHSLLNIEIQLHPFSWNGDLDQTTQTLAESIYGIIQKNPTQWITFDRVLEVAS